MRMMREYKRWGLLVNLPKSICLVINSDDNLGVLIIDNTRMEQANKLKYFGTINNLVEREIRHRIRESRIHQWGEKPKIVLG